MNNLHEKMAARYRRELQEAAMARAKLIEEIAYLEAYVQQLSDDLADVQAGREDQPEADAWGDQPTEAVGVSREGI